MLVRIASDLHLEAFMGMDVGRLAEIFLPIDPDDGDSVLVLAGDISSKPHQLIGFITHVARRFLRTIFVPGNHELYFHNFQDWNNTIARRLGDIDGVHASGADGVGFCTINGVGFITGTLWGDGGFTVMDEMAIQCSLNDFRHITWDGGERFSVEHMKALYQDQKRWIGDYLTGTPHNKKAVVVTHHLPSRRLVAGRFTRPGGDGINGGFVGACDELFGNDHSPVLWVHGHTHDTVDQMIGGTRVVANPAGYRTEWNTPYNRFMTAPVFKIEV